MCGGISLVGDVMSLVVESFFFRRIILGARLVGGAVDGLFVTVSLLILMEWLAAARRYLMYVLVSQLCLQQIVSTT